MLESHQLVGPYEVRHVLGRGGMGTVYLAVDLRLGRRVALKVLDRVPEGGPDAILAEARLNAGVSHPAIVAVYDVGELDGQPWLALEYVDGRSLGAVAREGRMSALQAARLLQPVAGALAAAHAAGIVHRDLKPDNILVARDGRPRVVDFGIATMVQGADSAGTITAGTPGYMAPEVWRGETVTGAADVWALGVTFYELLTGVSPWETSLTSGAAAVRAAVCGSTEAPTLPDGEDLPPALVQLVRRCLDPAPVRRPSAGQVADELERVLRRSPIDDDACPYRGLLPYEAEHAGSFFGRDADVTSLVEAIEAHPRLAMVGPSGVGKSSLVHAGVVPRLRERGTVLVISLRPGPTPVATLASAVQKRLEGLTLAASTGAPETVSMDTAEWAEAPTDWGGPREPEASGEAEERAAKALEVELRATPGRLGVLLQRLATARRTRVVLVVDQLEELETQGASGEERRVFVEAVASAALDPSDPVRVVVTLRDDHLGRLAAAGAHPLLAHLEVVRPLDAAALALVVREPLVATGHRFDDPTLVDAMVAEVADTPGALPLLQFAARRMWDLRDRDRRLLRRADYDAVGGVAGALASHAEEIVRQLMAEEEAGGTQVDASALVQAMLLRLVHDDGTRRAMDFPSLIEGLTPVATAVRVRERLVTGRLLVVQDGEGGARSVELAHESLAVQWERLRRWRLGSREEVRLLADVEEGARLWDRRGRPEEGLWAGDALALAERTLSGGVVGLSDLGRAFFTASAAREQRDRLRRRQRMGAALMAGAIVTLVSVGAAIAYNAQADQAVREAAAADEARATALISSAQASWAAGEGLEARARLRAGFEHLDTPGARALWSDLRGDARLWHQDDAFSSFQMLPSVDGTHAVVASGGGLIRLVELATAKTVALRVGRLDVAAVAVTPDLSTVAGVRYDGSVVRWRPTEDTWEEFPVLAPPEQPFRTWFAGDGKLVVLAVNQGSNDAALWNVDLDAPSEAERMALSPGHLQAAVDVDQGWLVTGGPTSPTLKLWSLEGGIAPEVELTLPAGVVPEALAVEHGAASIVVFGRRTVVLDRAGGIVQELSAPDERVRGGGYMGGGLDLVAITYDGALVAWELATGNLRVKQAGAVPPTSQDVVVTNDGHLLYTHLFGFGVLEAGALGRQDVGAGHTGRADAIAVSPDGAWVASGASDAQVTLRDALTGTQKAASGPLGGSINAVRFAPSGRFVAVAANGGVAAVLSVPGLEEVARVVHNDDVVAAELLDDTTLRTLTWSGVVRDVAVDGPAPVTRSEHALGVEAYDLRVGPDGVTWLALTDGRVAPLLAGGRVGPTALLHTSPPHSLGVAKGVVAAAGFDDWVRLSQPARTMPALTDGRVALSADGRTLAYPGTDGRLVLQDVADGHEHGLAPMVAPVDAVAFSPDGATVYGAARGGSVLAWDAASGKPAWRGVALMVSPPAVLTHRGWTVTPGSSMTALWTDALAAEGFRADLEGDDACALTLSGRVVRWASGAAEPVIDEAAEGAIDVALLGSGCAVLDAEGLRWVAPGGVDQRLGPARTVARHGAQVEALADDQLLAWAGEAVAKPPVHVSPEATAALHVAGTLCTGFDDGQVLCEGRPPLRGMPSAAVTVALPYQQDFLVAGFADGTVGVWSVSSGAPLMQMKVDGSILRVAPTPQGLLALSVSGSVGMLDTSAFDAPWCDILSDLTQHVPVVWTGERVELAGGPVGPCAAQ